MVGVRKPIQALLRQRPFPMGRTTGGGGEALRLDPRENRKQRLVGRSRSGGGVDSNMWAGNCCIGAVF